MLAKLLFIGAITLPEYEAHVHRGNYIERQNKEFYKQPLEKPSNAPNPSEKVFGKPK